MDVGKLSNNLVGYGAKIRLREGSYWWIGCIE